MVSKLPGELTSLIHHVQLNEAGWLDRGMLQIITSIIWLNNALPKDKVSGEIERQFSISIAPQRLSKYLETLTSIGSLVELPNGTLKVSEHKLRELATSISKSEEID